MTISLGFQAVDRILLHTFEQVEFVPDAYKPPSADQLFNHLAEKRNIYAKLASKISWAFTRGEVVKELGNKSSWKKRANALAKISKAMGIVDELLQSDEGMMHAVAEHLADNHPLKLEGVGFLRELAEAAKTERNRIERVKFDRSPPLATLHTRGVAFQPALIGRLGDVFEEAFDRKVSIKYSRERDGSGEFVRFVQAIFAEVDGSSEVDRTPGAITRAWNRSEQSKLSDTA